ncbi:hypothetical protein [Falsiroseomonas sp. HW251]|uniref:hypothetical protein n=1 Tax=Falsiroseomonas sp. HW251 TaxID=3390998 RepID=UPI003D31954F
MALIAGAALAGIALAPLAGATRPALLRVSLAIMMLALLRIEPAALSGVLRRAGLALLILAWVTLGMPAIVYALLAPVLPAGSPWLAAAMLIAATPSVIGSARLRAAASSA